MRANGRDTRRKARVAIIGGGFSGIAAAVALKRKGISDFTIYDRSDSVGGTWWDNHYPGAAVDTPSLLYSYSYAPYAWKRTHARQAEVLEYLRHVVDLFELNSHFELGTEVERVEWREDIGRWSVELSGGRTELFNAVVSATGLLNVPRYPAWPGLEDFGGPVFHTARWPKGLSLAGKRVAIAGSGSTAAQVVPAVAEEAAQVLMFQREPGWVLPKGARDLAADEHEAHASATAQRLTRWYMLVQRERASHRNNIWRPGSKRNAAAEQAARAFIERSFHDRPDLAKAVTPDFPFGGKRPVVTDELYPAMARPNVRLVPAAVTRVGANSVVDAEGETHTADVLIMSTGFMADFSTSFETVGVNGKTLDDEWAGEPNAFLGIMVPGFPNYFIMYGPNTNGGQIVPHLEAQAKYLASAVELLETGKADAIEVRPAALNIFNSIVQKRLSGTSFERANNYFKSSSGRVVTQWSDGAMTYVMLTKLFRRSVWRTRKSSATPSTQLRSTAAEVAQPSAPSLRTGSGVSGVTGGLSKLRTLRRDVRTLIALDSVTVFSQKPVDGPS
ncbi:flavin-containing monooxygenase [Rhodococcus opacus]|uniref:flavin-containing monooxygenase n=1 Tax=Rhodococcus opacus TaxID=37919 RepID=UPI0024743655|nr:NAD(P)/FAD-dependent oxidoreductase [Rhodococcus opacus]MDH6291332.1 cation diffusion facilitator CzcD-associated flavoprotein CzcO [Rhodococcus opacus]